MSNGIVRAAIEGALAVWAAAQSPAIPVVFENMKYVPTVGARYIKGFLMPANTLNPSQGGLHKHYHGMYQISVYVPEGVGPGAAETLTKAIEVLFKSPTTIVHSGRNVSINRTPAVARGMPVEGGFWMVPVTIWYDMDDFS